MEHANRMKIGGDKTQQPAKRMISIGFERTLEVDVHAGAARSKTEDHPASPRGIIRMDKPELPGKSRASNAGM